MATSRGRLQSSLVGALKKQGTWINNMKTSSNSFVSNIKIIICILFIPCLFLLGLDIQFGKFSIRRAIMKSDVTLVDLLKTFTSGKNTISQAEGQLFTEANGSDPFNEVDFRISIKRSRGPGYKQRLPDAIIIGTFKSGTGALKHFLKMNNDVFCARNETYFFNRHYHLGSEWYRKQMPFTWTSQVTIEKSPTYYVNESTAVRIWRMNPKIVLILVVRNPVDRAISGWLQKHVKYKKGDNDTVRDAFFFKNRTLREDNKQIRLSLYAEHLKKYLNYFSLKQIHVVDGDNLKKNPAVEMRKVERFLGLPFEIVPSRFVWDKKKRFYCYWKGWKKKCLDSSKGREHPRLDPWMVKAFKSYFRPLNKQFYELIGQKFDWD